ncbi:MAG: gamma carbonic anhydrase family protein [Candidatus Korarchaeota archaeon]|nr:gamma carbonic anhydrase family protein [Candidatus Korarchaeota archaeon]NIU82565.1 gamma carbonic anhydrase family protein [Candidatus Thorarchaeota archaeon]NIW13053.1 gamma carbonic anhydrase family protein [Candidatus Thorarchaeota archaeon]NIW51228.1 gamma carbonic anhydrase family protein [Candidatus Korarchaeota archaeon]
MKLSYKDKQPTISNAFFVAKNASIIGDVRLRNDTMVFFNAVLRGEDKPVVVEERSAVLDNAFVEGSRIGGGSLISHGATVHFAEIGEKVLIGIGAIVLDECIINQGAVIGAGAVVLSGTEVGENSLYTGVPAEKVKNIQGEKRVNTALASLREKCKHYHES